MATRNTTLERTIREAELTQSELARRVRVSRFAIHQYVNGTATPTLLIALRITTELDTTIEELWTLRQAERMRREGRERNAKHNPTRTGTPKRRRVDARTG